MMGGRELLGHKPKVRRGLEGSKIGGTEQKTDDKEGIRVRLRRVRNKERRAGYLKRDGVSKSGSCGS